jgi:aminoglycoside phosphotransferase (APT) family kinase protein
MGYTSYEIAALATTVLKGCNFTGVWAASKSSDFDQYVLVDDKKNKYLARVAKNDEAKIDAQAEISILKELKNQTYRIPLPFHIQEYLTAVNDAEKHISLFSLPIGLVFPFESMNFSKLSSLAVSLAALHSYNTDIAKILNLPIWSASEVRHDTIGKLDDAKSLGNITDYIYSHFESYVTDDTLFDFEASLVHSNLQKENLLFLNDKLNYVIGWQGLQVNDPALDLSYITSLLNDSQLDTFLQSYSHASGVNSAILVKRVRFYEEFEIVKYLLHAIKNDEQDMLKEANELLSMLENDLVNNDKRITLNKKYEFAKFQDTLPTISISTSDVKSGVEAEAENNSAGSVSSTEIFKKVELSIDKEVDASGESDASNEITTSGKSDTSE